MLVICACAPRQRALKFSQDVRGTWDPVLEYMSTLHVMHIANPFAAGCVSGRNVSAECHL